MTALQRPRIPISKLTSPFSIYYTITKTFEKKIPTSFKKLPQLQK